MRTILLSIEKEWFEYIKDGKKKFEYRKKFPKDNLVQVFFYVSRPVKGICGRAVFGEREELYSWLDKYKNRNQDVIARIKDFLTECRYAMPILEFQPTEILHLKEIQKEIKDFVVPRMYYFIDNSKMLKYLNENLTPNGELVVNNFGNIKDEDLC